MTGEVEGIPTLFGLGILWLGAHGTKYAISIFAKTAARPLHA